MLWRKAEKELKVILIWHVPQFLQQPTRSPTCSCSLTLNLQTFDPHLVFPWASLKSREGVLSSDYTRAAPCKNLLREDRFNFWMHVLRMWTRRFGYHIPPELHFWWAWNHLCSYVRTEDLEDLDDQGEKVNKRNFSQCFTLSNWSLTASL